MVLNLIKYINEIHNERCNLYCLREKTCGCGLCLSHLSAPLSDVVDVIVGVGSLRMHMLPRHVFTSWQKGLSGLTTFVVFLHNLLSMRVGFSGQPLCLITSLY